jgi:hypothetical protein
MPMIPSQLSSHQQRLGYSNRRSPGAMAAALVINGGIIGLMIALPATHYLKQAPLPPTTVRFVPIDPLPPPPDPKTEPVVQAKTNIPVRPDPLPDQPYVEQWVDWNSGVTLSGGNDLVLPPLKVEPPPWSRRRR